MGGVIFFSLRIKYKTATATTAIISKMSQAVISIPIGLFTKIGERKLHKHDDMFLETDFRSVKNFRKRKPGRHNRMRYSCFLIIFASNNSTMEMVITSPVSFTAAAIEEVKRLLVADNPENYSYLRVGVKGGGCSGMTYILGFDKKEDNDEIYSIEGIDVIMNKAHGIYLMGMEVDFSDGLNARGFVFKNPNATSTCGCGTSFAV